jgi:hypothetical protein
MALKRSIPAAQGRRTAADRRKRFWFVNRRTNAKVE